MGKKSEADIERLQKEIDEIKLMIIKLMNSTADGDKKDDTEYKHVQPMKNMHPDPVFQGIMNRLCKTTEESERTGTIAYLGVFTSGNRQSNWIQNEVNTDELLALIENKSASAVLQCIGNNDRLHMLLTLLRTPMTVAALVDKCGFNSTGQVYHLLKPLIAADIVAEINRNETENNERGVYAVKGHRVQGIIMLLAGIADLTDGKYSQGNWVE